MSRVEVIPSSRGIDLKGMLPPRRLISALLFNAGTALALSLATAGPAGAQATASAPDHPFDSRWLAAELARLGGEITAVVPPASPHPKDPVLLNHELTKRPEPTVDSTQVVAGGTIRVRRRKRERADPAAQSFYYGQASTYLQGTKRWMHHAFYATCGRLDAAPLAPPCRAVLTLNAPTEPEVWIGVAFPRGDLAAMDATMRTAAELVVARTAEGRPLLLAPRPGAWDAALLPPPLPPEPNGPRPGEVPTLDDHPFDAAWLAAELARRGAAVTAVVPDAGPHPTDPGQALANLLRNRATEFEVDAPAFAEPHTFYGDGFVRLRRRGDPGAGTYYDGGISSGTRDPHRGVGFGFFAFCERESTGPAQSPCRAAIRSRTWGKPDTWIGVALPRGRAAEFNVMLHYAAELIAAHDAEGSPLWLPPQPGAWDGLGRVPEAPPEAAGDPRPGEAAEERDHPFSSAWLGAELAKRGAYVTKAVRAPGERVGSPEGRVFGYVRAKAGGALAELQNDMLRFQGRWPDHLGWYSSRAWTARGGAAVAYRFGAQCNGDTATEQFWTVCQADTYLEQPDMWLRVRFPSARRAEVGTIVHYAAEAAVAAEAEGRPMRGLFDTHP